MTAILTLAALAIGYGAWWLAPSVQAWIGLDWTGDLGQLCLVILALSLLGKLEVGLASRTHGS